MLANPVFKPLTFLVAVLLLTGCADGGESLTAVGADAPSAASLRSMHGTTASIASTNDPFTFRAPVDPYFINQAPDFMMRSRERTDIVFQRSVFAPGAGSWHTHPGPSFVYVIQGQIKLERVIDHSCVATPVHGPGATYHEIGNQVHRAVVVSADSAVLLVTRFNIPVGGPITIPASDPGC